MRRGLTQKEMVRLTGISRGTYLRLERGVHPNPRIGMLANCAIVLGVELEELIEPQWRRWVKPYRTWPDEPPNPSELWHADES
jgi:transcriptional regulator with XRE-family HTH domain